MLEQINDGYENQLLVDMIVTKNKSLERGMIQGLDRLLLSILLTSIISDKKTIAVLDHGGQCGHYKRILPNIGVDCKWAVVETGAMAKAASVFQTEDLRFFNTIDEAILWLGGGCDLIWSSGALQYVDSPFDVLNNLINCEAKVITWSRMAFSSTNEILVGVQKSRLKDNGPGPLPENFIDTEIEYMRQLIPKDKFLDINLVQYDLITEFSDSSSYLFVRKKK